MPTEQEVIEALKQCYDPEIPVNIVDLGLVYHTQVEENKVRIQMTLTAQGCGMGPSIAAEARARVLQIPGVQEAQVDLVWDPPWNPGMMSEEAKKTLGFEG